MAQYDMTKEVKELAKIKGVSTEEICEEFTDELAYYNEDDIQAWGRSGQTRITVELNKAKATMVREDVKNNKFHWIKDHSGKWAVTGNVSEVKVGDKIEVFKVNGDSQVKKIINIKENYMYVD